MHPQNQLITPPKTPALGPPGSRERQRQRNMTNSSEEMVDDSSKPNRRPFISRLHSIGHKVREAVECRVLMKSTTNSSTESIDQHKEQQPQDHPVHELQQEPSKLEVVVEKNEGENAPEDEPRPPESEGVLSSIKEKLEQVRKDNQACSWRNLSIYRIPHYLKHGEDKAYVPQIVSLGPYYHGKTYLRQMEWHKFRCLEHILRRTGHEIGLYQESVKEVEDKARACYEGEMRSEKFVEMMVLDGCFVMELFLGVILGFETLGYPSNDPIFSLSRSMHMIQGDMLKLENQIPLFILDQLLNLQFGISDRRGFVAALAFMFFKNLMLRYDPLLLVLSSKEPEFEPDHGGLHCLDVFRMSLLGSGPRRATKAQMQWSQGQQRFILCVTDLREAGIGFNVSSGRFWDIKFKDGTLQIPQLLIHKGTRSLFLNLIAFEQSHFRCSNEITAYIIFMDNLIDSPEDVKYLRKRGIIKHGLGSDAEVADLFNRLCQEVVFNIEDSYLRTLSQAVNKYERRRSRSWRAYLKHKWNASIAILKHNYFSNPWSTISVIAAFVLLVLTSTQTFYGVYGYYRPSS